MLFLLIYGLYSTGPGNISTAQSFLRDFYIHHFHAAPKIQSVLNPQVNSEMSHNLLLLQYYQSKRRKVQAVYRHFLQSIPTFFFTTVLFKAVYAGTSRPASYYPLLRQRQEDQLNHKRLKIRFSALL